MTLASIVLPVHNQADHIGGVVDSYRAALERVALDWQIVLVSNASTDDTPEICRNQVAEDERLRFVELPQAGWGRAVKAGLAVADGDLLCYTNSARTQPEMLTLLLLYATAYPQTVIKANRRLRDSLRRRLGSALYNLECRALFDLATWDINGTPKVFPRSFDRLLALQRDDDLIDAEFVVTCRKAGYPILEVPVQATVRHSGKSTTGYGSALRMYLGAFALRRQL